MSSAQNKWLVPAWFFDAYKRRAPEEELLKLVEKSCQEQLDWENRILGESVGSKAADENWVRSVYMFYLNAVRK